MAGPILFRPSSITTGLVGYWKLNEASGNRADSSGNGNTLTDNNTVTSVAYDYWKTGESSADFEASNSEYLSIANGSQTGLGITSTYSFVCFFRPESIGVTHTLASKWATNGYIIGIDNATNRIFIQNESTVYVDTTTTLAAGKWYHLAFVYDDTNNLANLYVNGNLVITLAATVNPASNSADFRLGTINAGGQYADGLMKDAAVWNVALTPIQIKSLALGVDLSTYAYRPNNVSPSPSSWWKLNELSSGGGAVTRSDSVSSNNLTDNNTVVSGVGYIEGVGADFEASNSEYLSAGDVLDITGTYSMSLWFRPESVNITQVFVGKSDGTNGYQFGLNSSGKMFVKHEATTYTDTGTALINGVWYHLAVRFDASANNVYFYLDGVLNSTIGSATVDPTNTAHNFHIGRRSSTDYVDGVLADVAIWTSTDIGATAIQSLACGIPLQQTGLVSYYKLDETSGNRADSIGSNTLVDNNTVLYGTGKVSNAADFESSNSEYLSIADASQTGLDLSGTDFTIACWIKPESSGSQFFIDKDNDTLGYALQKSAGDVPVFIMRNLTLLATTTLSNGTWYFVVGVYDQATKRIFVNSAQENSSAQTTDCGDNSDAFELGRVNASSNYYDGLMDELPIIKRWLRDEEIKTIYCKGLCGKELTSSEIIISGGSGNSAVSTFFLMF